MKIILKYKDLIHVGEAFFSSYQLNFNNENILIILITVALDKDYFPVHQQVEICY